MPSVASISSACKLAEQLCLMQHAEGSDQGMAEACIQCTVGHDE